MRLFKLPSAIMLATMCSFLFSGCNQDGWKSSPTGLKYWILKDEPGEAVQIGDIVEMHVKYASSNDSVLFNSFTMPKPITMEVPKPQFKGSFEEGITLLSPGDSAQFLVAADSIFREEFGVKRPSFIDSGSYLTFTVKILSSQKKEAFMEKQNKEREEMEKNRAVNSVKQKEIDEKLIADYISKNGIKASRTPEGVYVQILKPGVGSLPESGDTVSVHYTGRTLEGDVFDSSVMGDGEHVPFDFVLGESPIIQGWQIGIAKLTKGSKATLIIPSGLAYAEQGTPKFGPNSVLTFEVEILKIIKPKK